jgi:putative membrane protein insertion efficiency factor
MSAPARLLLFLVHAYQGLRAGRPSGCRFVPSCSVYAEEAVVEHGALRGSWLAFRRLSRCHPLGGHGFDPVPPAAAR